MSHAAPSFDRLPAWAAVLEGGAIAWLGVARLEAGWEGALEGGAVWVRGPKLSAAGQTIFQRVPWQVRYEVTPPEGLLRRPGQALAERTLPALAWQPLRSLLPVMLPAGEEGGGAVEGLVVTLEPGGALREPTLLETRTADWRAWVETAPAIRLGRLAFARDLHRAEWVLVRGEPLPPLAGSRWVEQDEVAVPAGQCWRPAVSAPELRAAHGVAPQELLLLEPHGWRRLPRAAWAPASRQAVRRLPAPESHGR